MKPILFNTEMVRAIQNGTKTVTRRVVKPQPLFHTGRKYIFADGVIPKKWVGCSNIIETYQYRPGDILYVRETWARGSMEGGAEQYFYKAGYSKSYPISWRPSIHMPREAARIFLRVTDVRVERLQDIDDDGVVAEGLEIGAPFEELWDSTIKKADRALYGWDTNPWVWVIEFERISREEALRCRRMSKSC